MRQDPDPTVDTIKGQFTAGEGIFADEFVRISGVDTVIKAQADSGANARLLGVVETGITIGQTGDVTFEGIVTAQFETGLTLSDNERVYLSATTAGALTNVAPDTSGSIILEVGVIKDKSGYVGTTVGNSKAEIVLQIKKGVENS